MLDKTFERVSAKGVKNIEKEDSPSSMNFQIDLIKQAGFRKVEILIKICIIGTFGGTKLFRKI